MNAADNAWVLASSALVLLMTPGLAMFYGGLTRAKNVLSTMMHSFFLMGLASAIWFIYGFSLSFAPDAFGGLLGGLDHFGLKGVGGDSLAGSDDSRSYLYDIPVHVCDNYPRADLGAFAERMKFSSFIVFMVLWMTLVYCPIAHWVWGPGGWLAKIGALDFAGGTVVHVNSGVAASGVRSGYR